MATNIDNSAVLLAWSEMVPATEGQDPLGLNLRVSARLSAQLLHCIRSYISTLRKHGLPVLEYLRRALDGHPFFPQAAKST